MANKHLGSVQLVRSIGTFSYFLMIWYDIGVRIWIKGHVYFTYILSDETMSYTARNVFKYNT